MQTNRPKHIVLTAALAVMSVTALRAGTVSPFYSYGAEPLAGGISYSRYITLDGFDTGTFTRHVGAWSWEDNSLFGVGEDPVGWTHTSDWVALTLTTPTTVTLRLEREAGVSWPSGSDPLRVASTASMFPSFTIWNGWDNDLAPQAFADLVNGGTPTDDWHTYNNDGPVAFAEDLSSVIGFVNNSTATFAEASYTLPAGQYSIVLGSNSPATDSDRQGYRATLTTAVPEPSAALMLLTGLGVLALRRRRQPMPASH